MSKPGNLVHLTATPALNSVLNLSVKAFSASGP